MFGLAKINAVGAALLSLSLLVTPASTKPILTSLDEDITPLYEYAKRAGGTYPITGTGGSVQFRLEIRTLYNQHPLQWDLYILAMRLFQSVDQTKLTSYFQIGGIHGSPNIPWDGVQQSAPGVGYCTHSINLFPTWHRPYIVLFEQNLVRIAKFIAKEYPSNVRQSYINAANNLRAPYWDWAVAPAAGLSAMPAIITEPRITVNTPLQGKQTVDNPLYQYRYHPLSQADFSPYGDPFDYWPTTLRWPQTNLSNAVSHDSQAAATIDNNRISQKQNLYNWFTLCPDYLEASNDQSQASTPSCHISLESLHNNVHVWVGGNNDGHMTVIPVSALDPTFMLHHTQIDRLFAMWQAIYPNSYTTNQVSNVDTFTINKGSVQGPDSPLTPFHSDTRGTFWTSTEVREWRIFYYDYPDFANGRSGSALRAVVNNLYGPNSKATAAGKKRELEQREPGVPVVPSVAPPLITASNGSTYQYIANIATTRFGLNGSYTVFMFMDPPTSEDPSTWSTDPRLTGSYGVFSTPGMTGSNLTTTGAVPLTDALISKVSAGLLGALDQALVVPFLKSKLQWRVATSNLQVVDPATIPNFVVSVVSSTMSQPTSPDAFPVWSPFNVLTQITHGKAGGLPLGGVLSYLGSLV